MYAGNPEGQSPDELFEEWNFKRKALLRWRNETDFVALDDLGKEHLGRSGFQFAELDSLFRTRYQRGLPTLLSSNTPMKDWPETYSPSFESFIHEACAIFPMTMRDYRKLDDDDGEG